MVLSGLLVRVPRMRSTRVVRIALLSAILTVALAASASAATVIHFQSESLPALEAQLHSTKCTR